MFSKMIFSGNSNEVISLADYKGEKENLLGGTAEQEPIPVFVTIADFARLMGLSYYAVRTMTMINGFPVLKIGNKKMILADDAKKWVIDQINSGRDARSLIG